MPQPIFSVLMEVLIADLFKGIKRSIVGWYRDRTGVAQKLQRLDMLVIKIRAVAEVSEKFDIKSENLRKWQQSFKDAADKGDEVLRQLQSPPLSSFSSSGVCAFFEIVSHKKNDMENLDNILERLEENSAGVKDFQRTLKLEASKLSKRKKIKIKEPKGYLELQAGSSDNFLFDEPIFLLSVPVGPASEDYFMKTGFFECCKENYFREPKKRKVPLLELPTCTSMKRMTIDDENNAEMSQDEDNSLVIGADTACSDADSKKTKVLSSNLPLPSEKIEEAAQVEELAAEIWKVYVASLKDEHGPWFSKWTAKLKEASKEAVRITSVIRKNKFCVNAQILEEVGVIFTAVRLRLECILINDLGDFENLLEAEALAMELTAQE